MKKTFTRLAALLLLTPALLKAQLTPEVLYYQFDGTGTSVPNLASAPPAGTATATIMGGLTQNGNGICGGSLVGTGASSTNDYVNTGWATSMTGSWTISFRTSNVPSTTSTYYILGDVNAGGLRVFTGGVAGAGNWILRGPLTDVLASGGASASASMTTFAYDATAGEIRAYVNGVLVNTIAQSPITLSGSGPFKVGAYSTSANLPSGSLMDEFRFYSRALTAAEVTQLYNPYATSGFLGADQSFCPSSPATLTTGWPAGTVLWSTSSTNDSIAVSTPGVYTVAITGGCGTGNDTIVMTSLESTSSISSTACTSYTTPSGATLTASGTYTDTIANAAACDSIITINLTILQPSASSITVTNCGAYTAPSGATLSTTGIYTDVIPNAVGCDSTITIDLTVNQPTTSSMIITSCGTYPAPSGALLTTTGIYTDVIPNAAGCDSTITIDLTVYQPTSSSITVSSCGMYTAPSGATYATSGTYTDIIPNTTGCDSTITIALTVNTVNVNTTQNGATLTAAASGATYQWIDCANNQPISNATSQSFTATANGSYAVIVTENSCTDTSSCLTVTGIGIAENAFASTVQLFPNPTDGNFTIELDATYEHVTVVVTDLVGRVVSAQDYSGAQTIRTAIDAPAGSYLVTVTANGQKAVLTMIRQ